MIKLSIIIPYYNAKPYTDKLLLCLDKQITDECEVLIIDDGSKEKYTTNYKWAKIIRQNNAGASAARNTGLDNAIGEYIAFIDSDDMISDNYISSIINKINEEHFDYCYISWDSFGGWDVTVKLNSVKDEFPAWNLCVWNRIWKKDLIGNIRLNTKKAIAEDAEFIRTVPTQGKKKSFISDILYHYRSNTPNSLTKRFANGELDMNRVVYHYNHITSDMTWLIDEVKETNKNAEVIILTNQNDILELYQYAMIMKPDKMKGTELRGEPTSLFIKVQKPIVVDTVIWTEKTFEIGGIESWIYNFSTQMKDTRDILVLYKVIDKHQLERLQEIVQCENVMLNRKIICNNIIVSRISDDIPKNVQYNNKIQMVHCCQLQPDWHIKDGADVIVPVSNVVAESFKKEIPDDKLKIINNLTLERTPKRVLNLISATRTTFEKGIDKIMRFAKELRNKQIPFVWLVFCDTNLPERIPGLIRMNPTLNIRDYIANSDYLLQFSLSEAFCYSIVEALQDGTPVISTPIPALKEIGFVENEMGFVVDFDLSNMSEVIDKMYNNTLSFNYKYNNTKIKKEWIKLLGKTEPKNDYKYTPPDTVIISVTKKYNDIEIGRIVRVGERLTVTKDRANQIIKSGFAKLL